MSFNIFLENIVDTGQLGAHKHIEYTFNGLSILQHPDIIQHFIKIIWQFDRIIELGTYNGALTTLLYKMKYPECELISYDIDTSQCDIPKYYNIDLRQGNFFDPDTINSIKELIQDSSKRVLLLCDGGCKEYEFNVFSESIKSDDVIMLHDYAETFEEYQAFTHPIQWYDVPESLYENIHQSVINYNLKRHKLYDDFKSVLWGVFTK